MATESNFARLRQLILEKPEDFFKDNFSEIDRTVEGYQFLKKVYHQHDHNLSEDRNFQKKFTYFYVMRFVSQKFRMDFFVKMDEIKNNEQTNWDAIEVTQDLCNGEKSLQFSFVTKMLNLADDARYPIYDSMVARVFGFRELVGTREEKLETYRKWYRQIIDTYRELQEDTQIQGVLAKFRIIFQCPDLSDFRVLDIICWQLGKQIEKEKNAKETEKKLRGMSTSSKKPLVPLIKLWDREAYNRQLRDVCTLLGEMQNTLRDAMWSMAVCGKWKEWDEQQPIGSTIYVSEDMLRNTGDVNVDMLVRIDDLMQDFIDKNDR